MKTNKQTLSTVVAAVFLVYSFALRHQDSHGAVIAPLTTSSKPPATSQPSSSSPPVTTNSAPTSTSYKDGTYTGSLEDAFYGNVLVSATIKSGKITAVNFLQYPNDAANSRAINQQAIPFLQQEAIQAQSSHVDIVSGATDTSQAFIQSLATALGKAQG